MSDPQRKQWKQPSRHKLMAYFLHWLRHWYPKQAISERGCQLLEASVVLCMEYKRQDQFNQLVKDCLKNLKDNKEVVE